MAKKPNLQKPIDVVFDKPNTDSKALKRVKAYGKSEGIYLSNEQLQKIINANKNANGVWFAIGNAEKYSKNTVEVLPVNRVSNKMNIINSGHFRIDDIVDFYLENLSICQNFEKSQAIRNMGLPRHIKQIAQAHGG